MTGIILFRGISQYQSLNAMAEALAIGWHALGRPVHVLDARALDFPMVTERLLAHGEIAAVVTISGFGLDIGTEAKSNLYGRYDVPVISLYFDPLHYYVEQLRLPIRRRIVTTSCDTDVGYWQQRQPPLADVRMLAQAADPGPVRPWSQRTVPLLFSATGLEDPEVIRAGWETLAPPVRNRLNRLVEAYTSGPPLRPLTTVIAEAVGREIDLSDPWVLRHDYLRLDSYLRCRYRWRLVTALAAAALPLLIVGERWDRLADHLGRRGGSRVRFQRPIDAVAIAAWLSRTRIAVNDSTPHHGCHERVLRAMAAGAAAVTGRTAWFAAEAPADALATLDLDRDDPAEVVTALQDDPARAEAMADAGRRWQGAHHTWRHRVATLDSWVAAWSGDRDRAGSVPETAVASPPSPGRSMPDQTAPEPEPATSALVGRAGLAASSPSCGSPISRSGPAPIQHQRGCDR